MTSPNFALLGGGNNALAMFQQGAQMGAQARARQKEHETETALATYAANPDAPDAVNALIKVDPRLGIQVQERQRAIAKENERRRLIPLAISGDVDAQGQLMGVDPELWMRLDDLSKKKTIDASKFIAGAAFDIIQRPEAERAAAWDAYIDQGVAMYPGLGKYKGQYSPQALKGLVNQAGQMKDFIEFQQPKYVPVGEGGLSGFQFGKPIMQGGQAQNFGNVPPPPPGFVINNGGPAPQTPGNFPGG